MILLRCLERISGSADDVDPPPQVDNRNGTWNSASYRERPGRKSAARQRRNDSRDASKSVTLNPISHHPFRVNTPCAHHSPCSWHSSPGAVRTDSPPTRRRLKALIEPQVTKFLKDHVIDKTIVSPKKTYKLDEGRLEVDHEDVTTFNNFTESANGFSFDMTIVKKYTRYDMGKDGKRVQPGTDRSATDVYRYEIAERRSTKMLTGTCRMVSTTSSAALPGRQGTMTLVTGIRISDGKLGWNETVPGYIDLAAPGGQYKPGSTDEKETFSVIDGRLRLESIITVFEVDPGDAETHTEKEKPIEFLAEEPEKKSTR